MNSPSPSHFERPSLPEAAWELDSFPASTYRRSKLQRFMNFKLLVCLLGASSLTLSAWAGSQGSYQVTGPVLELTDTKIVVQKGDEKWELARTPDTKVTGALKVGSKVTISYAMTAKSVAVK